MVEPKPDMDPAFHTYDLTLTDRELEDFLSFMEHQTTGSFTDTIPQLPDVAADFPGLQLQPHTDSPSNSEGSESIGVDPPVVGLPQFAGSTASFSTADQQQGAASGDASPNTWGDAMMPDEQQLPASSLMETSNGPLPKLEAMEIKIEPDMAAEMQQRQQVPSPVLPLAATPAAMPAAQPAAGTVGAPRAAAVTAMATLATAGNGTAAPAAAAATANSMSVSLPFSAAAVQQPAALGLQGMVAPNGVTLPVALGQWTTGTAAAAGSTAAGGVAGQQALPQVLFIQGPAAAAAAAAAARNQQQQQQQAGLLRSSSAAAVKQEPVLHRAPSSKLHRMASNACGDGSSSSGGKLQVSHSTVEKQRRDRLNSLIDELSDIVPPADPKYGNDATSVRRPKHVVLADTINLLKAMQAKLQIEEAEICTLKQQAAAVAAMAASQHQQQGMVAAAAAANGCAPQAGLTAGADGLATAGSAGEAGIPVLPLAPDSGVPSTGVLVEQGVNCLFVKVNCRDRKGLLSDVVSALKAFPLVISTAAITTTKDGTVHDVFEVRIEDESVTAEDIQCAVHMALFASERARSKRLRQDSSIMRQEDV